ncbi:MAG: cupin domain-containing protein [Bacilli bacterium]|nr:cupin domain-containing protein [Bacilli bacterium]
MEKVIILFESLDVRVERIYSNGEISAPGFYYNQEEDEFVKIEKGKAIIEVEGEEILLTKGGEIFLERHTKHRINYTSDDCVWYCIFRKHQ